ncbi:MAG: peptidoglycan DD-metalloendopeptidase family protein [Gammaproteobacteria bacterium]|nr:peptidoglycan DD-metalloendopeptidase family protein [Gammaproteobacteria bacterium]
MPRTVRLPRHSTLITVFKTDFLHLLALLPAAVAVCALALVMVLLPSLPGAYADEIAVQAEKLQQLRERIDEIRHDIDSMRDQRDSLQGALKKTESEIGSVTAELRQLDVRIATVRQKIQDLYDERSTENARLDIMRAGLAQELQVAYMAGKQEQVKLILSQEDPVTVGRLLVYHGYYARARVGRMQELLASLQHMSEIEQILFEKQAEIVQLRQQQADKSSRLADEQDKRRKILGQLQTDLHSRTTELTTLEQDQVRLQKLVQSLTLALQDFPQGDGQYTSLQQLKGKLRWPVAGRITQPFGAKDAHGTLRTRGVHITTRAGSDVQAIANGRIAYSDWLRGFGLLLIIDHGNGYMSLYGQNQSLYKEVGEWVERGETIAAAGDGRGQANAGLYLELRKDGKPFNPGRWFSGKPVPLQATR